MNLDSKLDAIKGIIQGIEKKVDNATSPNMIKMGVNPSQEDLTNMYIEALKDIKEIIEVKNGTK